MKSPIPYTGATHKHWHEFQHLVPDKFDVWFEPFLGGGSGLLNAHLDKSFTYGIVADICKPLIELHKYLAAYSKANVLITYMEGIIAQFNLSNKNNKAGYYDLRARYNKNKSPLDLLVLLWHSFNNMLRFNGSGGFNVPYGKRTVNWVDLTGSLKHYLEALQYTVIDPIDFSTFFATWSPDSDDFVFLDPPYLTGGAAYNTGWGVEEETLLLQVLLELDQRGVPWGLTNAISNNGKTNLLLNNFIGENDFMVLTLGNNYKNAYRVNRSNKGTVEVYVTNATTNMLK